MELDPRLGIKKADKREYPTQSISGGALPPKPYTIIGIGSSEYFAVQDTFISGEKVNTLVLELEGIVQSYDNKKSKPVIPKAED